jgi:glutathione synthase/RimK-type ligase-like ATP-grasp enzyme
MQASITLDDSLLQEALGYAQVEDNTELIQIVLQEFINNHRRKDVRELRGQVRILADYDYKKARIGG